MPLLPVAAREARGAARSIRNYAWRTIIAALGLVLVLVVLSTTQNPAILGRLLFSRLMLIAFLYCTIAGVLRTADAIAEEKRENTLGLLFLTDLKAYDVLTGKLLASSVTIFFGLLAMLPLLAIPLLMGGVTFQLIVLASLNLLNTLFLSISFGFLMSTLLREAWAAICLGLVAMFFLTFALPQLASFFFNPSSNLFAGAATAMLFSPTYALRGLDGLGPANLGANPFFWRSLAAVHLLAWMNILLTLGLLPIVWRDNPRGVRAQAWWTRMQRLRFGGTKTRTRFRTRLLKANPLFWLAGREQVSSSGLMAVLVGIVVISLTGDWQGISFGLVTLHLILLARMASAASHNLAEDRKSGALELLLATRLSVREVLRGRWMALGRQFFGPILIVSMWHIFAFVWLIILETYTESSLLILCVFPVMLLAWVATGWTGMWFGLRSRTPISAMWMTFCCVLIIPAFLIVSLLVVFGNLPLAPRGAGARQDNEFAIGAGVLCWGIYLGCLNAWSGRRLRTSFREAATDRFTALQPYDWRPFRRFARRFGVTVATLALMVLLWRWFVNVRGERMLRLALAAHPEFSRREPNPPFIPPEKNLAKWDYFSAIDNGTPPRATPFSVGRRPPDLRDIIQTPYQYHPRDIRWQLGKTADLLTPIIYLAREKGFDSEMARLHQAAAERPHLRFLPPPPNFSSRTDYLRALHHFIVSRACARVTSGQRPLDDVLLAQRLACSTTNHAGDFKHFQEFLFDAIQPIYDGFIMERWTDEDLVSIQSAFHQIDLFPVFDEWRQDMTRRLLDALDNPDSQANTLIYGYNFSARNRPGETPSRGEIRVRQAEIVDFGLGGLAAAMNREKRTLHPVAYTGRNRSTIDFQFMAQNAIHYIARSQTAVDQVVTACALERFRHANGHLPSTLAELIPKYLPRIPTDIVDGEPLRYRPQAAPKNYLLYSIAFNFVDDQGDIEQANHPNGAADWSWICKR